MKRLKYLFLFLVMIALDQVTKYWARAEFIDGNSMPILPKVLSFVYVKNNGAAWGLFSGHATLLSLITLVSVIALLYCFFKLPMDKKYSWLRVIMVSIAAGAIGNNLLDRIIHGYVIDFISFELIDFPVFNVADMYVVIGTSLCAFLMIFKYKEEDFKFIKKRRIGSNEAKDSNETSDTNETSESSNLSGASEINGTSEINDASEINKSNEISFDDSNSKSEE